MTTTDVQLFKTVDKIKTAIELGQSENLAADVAKLVAMTAAGVAAELAFRAYSALEGLGNALSAWRLGKAVSGREADIERSKVLAGFVAAELVGQGIDYVNDWGLGGKIYDWLHPDDDVAKNWGGAQQAQRPRVDPLVLDLDGDGLESIGINPDHPVYFDLSANGVQQSVGWVKGDDGFLVRDLNGNGTIDSGAELFGDATTLTTGPSAGQKAANGFAALADLDSNADGQITSADAAFASLKVWRDLNQDGVSQSYEVFSLAEAGVAALNVAVSSHSMTLVNGNRIADLGSYVRSDGSAVTLGDAGLTGDIDLAVDTFHTQFVDTLPITPEAEALPDMQGAGQVRTLREAASVNSTLAALLTQFAGATTRSAQMALMDGILKERSNTSTMATTFTGAYAGHALPVNIQGASGAAYTAWAEKLSLLERFNGRTFNAVPAGTGAVTVNVWTTSQALLQQSYDALKTSVYQSLALQTRLKPYLDQIGLTVSESGVALDFSDVGTAFDARLAADPVNGLTELAEFTHFTSQVVPEASDAAMAQLTAYVANHTLTTPQMAALTDTGVVLVNPASPGALVWANSLGGIALGNDQANTLYGRAGDDLLSAGAGNDVWRDAA